MDQLGCDCRVEPARTGTEANGRPTTDVNLFITGMGCSNCALRVQNALLSVQGVTAAQVKLAPPIATVRSLRGEVSSEQLIAAVRKAGQGSTREYHAYELDLSADGTDTG